MRLYIPLTIICLAAALAACRSARETKNPEIAGATAPLTNTEVIAAVREALTVSIRHSIDSTSADGFAKNDSLRLPFPPEMMKVRQKAIDWGFQSYVDQFETTMNQASGEAVQKALPVFGKAISDMTIDDGFAILNGGEGAATAFLRQNTEAQLYAALYPIVDAAVEKAEVTKYWDPIINRYNQAMIVAGKKLPDTDLSAYITRLTIAGLFKLMEKEENKIRKSPAARVSKRLQRVFGSI